MRSERLSERNDLNFGAGDSEGSSESEDNVDADADVAEDAQAISSAACSLLGSLGTLSLLLQAEDGEVDYVVGVGVWTSTSGIYAPFLALIDLWMATRGWFLRFDDVETPVVAFPALFWLIPGLWRLEVALTWCRASFLASLGLRFGATLLILTLCSIVLFSFILSPGFVGVWCGACCVLSLAWRTLVVCDCGGFFHEVDWLVD